MFRFFNVPSISKSATLALFLAFGLVACQQAPPPAHPSGDYTVVDGSGATTDKFVTIDGAGYILYEICVQANGTVNQSIIDRGIIIRKGQGFTYTSSSGGNNGVLTPVQNGNFGWQDDNAGPGGTMNPKWKRPFPPCP